MFGRWETTAILCFTATGSAVTSMPSTMARPPLGRTRVVRIPIVVVLPAALGPSRPKISPSPTVNETPRNASGPSAP